MSLTQAETVFGSVHEQGLNDLLRAFFTARPRHLNYGTPFFVPVTTAAATSITPPVIPGVGSPQFAILFTIPTVDIHPDSSGGASALIPGPGQFVVQTTVTLALLCGGIPTTTGTAPIPGELLQAQLTVFALCHPVVVNSAPGTGQIGVAVDQVEIVDIQPGGLESILECLILMVLQGALGAMRLPFNTITAGAFGLILLAGPLAEEDQVKVRGNAL